MSDKDYLAIFKGNFHALRAVEVAVAGEHSICIMGPPQSGKSMLIYIMEILVKASNMLKSETIEVLDCPCGYRLTDDRECVCTQQEIKTYKQILEHDGWDIYISLQYPTFEQLFDTRLHEPIEDIAARIKAAYDNWLDLEPDPLSLSLLKTAYAQLKMTPAQVHRCLAVALTIANLGGEKQAINSAHMAEAIRYRLR